MRGKSGSRAGQFDPRAALARIHALIERGQLAQAREQLSTLVPQLPSRADLLSAAGAASFRARDPHTALHLMQRVVALTPADAAAQHNLGEVQLALGQFEAAGVAYHQAVQINPGNLASQLGLAATLAQRGRSEEAEHAYRQVLERQSGHPGAQLGLGNALRAQGNLAGARDAYRAAGLTDPSMLSAYNNLGGVLQEMADFEAAETAYLHVVERQAGHGNAWYNLGLCRRKTGRAAEAVDALRRAVGLSPTDPRVLMNYAAALQDHEQFDEALQAYRNAIELVPASEPRWVDLMGKLHSSLADVHMQRGDLDAALDVCEAYLAKRPGDSSLLAVKAMVQNDRGCSEAVRQLIDYECLIRPMRLTTPPGYPSLDAFNRAVARHVRTHPSLKFATGGHATRGGLQSGSLLAEPKGPIADLEWAIRNALGEHERLIRQSDPEHPFLRARPEPFDLIMWGVVLQRGGHQTTHIHPASWVSGVYYPQVPASVADSRDTRSGWLEFARSPDWFHPRRKMASRAFPPEEGGLFLFPAYLWHRTLPLHGEEERISIAFDTVPARAG